RVGLAVDPRKTSTVFALVDAKRPESGFFRSDDGGNSWTRIGRQTPGAGRGGGFGRGAAPASPPEPCKPLNATAPRLTTPAPVERREPVSGAAALTPVDAGDEPEPAEEDEQEQQGGGRQGAANQPNDDCYRGGGAQYYHEIYADPYRADTIWSVNV